MKRSLCGAVALAAVALTVVLVSAASAAKPPPAPSNNTCPTNAKGLQTSNIVGAGVSISGSVSTYTFDSFTDPAQTSQGVPGLINYCVYTTANPGPTAVTVDANLKGADGSAWTASKPGKNFGFSRPGGDKTNIPLDGQTVTMGTATWAASAPDPKDQTLVLHISNSGECSALGITSPTCFVLPGAKPGPVCDAASSSDVNAAYNSIPKDAVDCGPPSHAFEGTQTKEFGNEVVLSKSGNLNTLKVLFNSYACEDFPLWNNSLCTTTNSTDTFTHPITANIYAANADHTVGALLATDTETQTIPYRPSADLTCVDASNNPTGAFRNSVTNQCTFSKKVVLSFSNWSLNGQPVTPNLSGNVIWTVAFNTSDYGDPSLRPQPCNATVAGCPYDSLNVGTMTFPGSPYAGTNADNNAAFINSTWNGIYCDDGVLGTGFLRVSTAPPTCTNTEAVNNYAPNAWQGFTPLATITLS